MTGPYVFYAPNGDHLLAAPSDDGDGVDVIVTEAGSRRRTMIKVPGGRLSDLVTGLYQQAGQPVPVLINPDEVADGWVKLDRNGGAA